MYIPIINCGFHAGDTPNIWNGVAFKTERECYEWIEEMEDKFYPYEIIGGIYPHCIDNDLEIKLRRALKYFNIKDLSEITREDFMRCQLVSRTLMAYCEDHYKFKETNYGNTLTGNIVNDPAEIRIKSWSPKTADLQNVLPNHYKTALSAFSAGMKDQFKFDHSEEHLKWIIVEWHKWKSVSSNLSFEQWINDRFTEFSNISSNE